MNPNARSFDVNPRPFYVVGGALPRGAASYVHRQADDLLYANLLQGQFCYVLTSRQMGKSSLMVRCATRLQESGVRIVVIDLEALGQNLTAEQWYKGLLNSLGRQLDVEDALDDFWFDHEQLPILQRWLAALEQVVLVECTEPIVVFIDEIDMVRSLPFSTDEFFAGVRACYNRRAQEPQWNRLTFCMLGVAAPPDLIANVHITPFNIGRRIELHDFTSHEAAALSVGLSAAGRSGEGLLQRVLYWTGGHPYLTQRLCEATVEDASVRTVQDVDALCQRLFFPREALQSESNLAFVSNRILLSDHTAAALHLYDSLFRGRRVADDETSPVVRTLKLSGLASPEGGSLHVRNRIYARVFDRTWIRNNMPDAELRRVKAAYRRGVLRAGLVFLVILGLLAALAGVVVWTARTRLAAQAAFNNLAEEKKNVADAKQLAAVQKQLAAAATEAQRNEHRQRQRAELEKRQAEKAREEANKAKQGAVKAGAQERAQRAIAEQQRAVAQANGQEADRLRQLAAQSALLEQARSLRLSGDIGRQFESLKALSRAAKYPMSPDMHMELRNEAIACLSLPIDLRPAPGQIWPGTVSGATAGCIGVKLDGSGYFYSDLRGNVTLRSLPEGHAVLQLPGFGRCARRVVLQDRNGRYLGIQYVDNTMIIWDTLTQHPVHKLSRGDYLTEHEFDFSRNGRMMVNISGQGKGTVAHVRELPSGREVKQIHLPSTCVVVRFHPSGRKLAFAYRSPQILIYDLETDKQETRQLRAYASDLDWSSDGKRLAGCCNESKIVYLWDGETGRQIAAMEVHISPVPSLAFNHRGDILASIGYDDTVCFCNATDGALLMRCTMPGWNLEFSLDDRHLVVSENLAVQRWAVTEPPLATAFSVVVEHVNELSDVWDVSMHPNGRLAAVATSSGVDLWDVLRGRKVGFLALGHTDSAFFSAKGKSLLTVGERGVRRWEVASNATATGETMRVGPAHLLRSAVSDAYSFSCLSSDGETLAANRNKDAVEVLETRDGTHLVTTDRSDQAILDVTVSPDKRYLAAGTFDNNVLVWYGKTGKAVIVLPAASKSFPLFSPDSRWLVTGSGTEYRFWAVSTWKPGFHVDKHVTAVSAMSCSPDGRLFAAAISSRKIWLGDPVSGRKFAELEWPDVRDIRRIHFSADGSQLIALSGDSLHFWDLRRIRGQLATMGLDWSAPPFPSIPHRVDPLRDVTRTLDVNIVPDETETDGARVVEIGRLERLIQAPHPSADSYNALAWFFCLPSRLENPQRAIVLAQKAVQMASDNWSYRNTLGVAYYRAGQYRQAVEALTGALRLNKGDVLGFDLYPLAMSYQRLGDRQRAQDCYTRAVHWQEEQKQIESVQDLIALRAEADTVLNAP